MTEFTLIAKEMLMRRTRLLLGLGAIVAGVSIIVSAQVITDSFRKAALHELDRLGPSMFILPEGLATADFLLMEYGDWVLPENYVETLERSGLADAERIEPRLLYDWVIGDHKVVLAGVTDGNLLWPGDELATVIGPEAAEAIGAVESGRVSLMGKTFVVSQVLPGRGDATDLTVFFRLRELQQLLGKLNLINEIGIIFKSAESARRVGEWAENALPGTRILTKDRIAEAKVGLASRLERLALAVAAVILLLGSVTIANYMTSNVRERRREIGILIAIGALPSTVRSLFLKKALVMGLAGGTAGFVLGAVMALFLAPIVARVSVSVTPGLLPLSLLLASACALAASMLPVRNASRADPAELLCKADQQ